MSSIPTQIKVPYPMANEILDQMWLEEGISREELIRSQRVSELFDALLTSGYSVDTLLTEWEGKSAEEILCMYAHRLPLVK